MSKAVRAATLEVAAVGQEVDAAVSVFRAALLRGESAKARQASEVALATFQRLLDAEAGAAALLKQHIER